MRAAIYVRISSDRTGEEAGVTRQLEDCRRRATDRGWAVVAEYSDNDMSATSGRRRPGFEAVLGAIAGGQVDEVIAWTLDRLQRSRRDELRLYELCRKRGVVISLVRGPDIDFDSPTGRYLADNLSALARLEVETKSDRQLRASRQAAEQGRRVGGRRPFGYDADGITTREDEASAIRRAYQDLLSGVPLAAIARDWNAAGLRSGQTRWKEGEKGRPSSWKPDTVRLVLKNPRNAGKRAYKGEVVAEAQWPAIVPEETWRAAHALLNDRRRYLGGGVLTQALLTGLAVCGVCGATVHAGGARPGVRGYRCSGSNGHVARQAQPVEDYVALVLTERLRQPDAAEALLRRRDGSPDMDALRLEATTLRSRLDDHAIDFADGSLTSSQLKAISARLRQRITALEAQMADAGRVDVLAPLVEAEDVQSVWNSLPMARRRAVINLLMRVTIFSPGRGVRSFRPETVGIGWK